MRIVRQHNLTIQAARLWAEKMLPVLVKVYGGTVSDPTYEWRDDVMEFSGRVHIVNLKGTLRVTDTELVLDVDGVPFFIEGKAKSEAERFLDEHLTARHGSQ